MTDSTGFSERDLLVTLLAKFEALERESREFRQETKQEFTELKDRVTSLERAKDRQSGFLAGANWLKGLLLTLPPAALAFFFGRAQ